MTALDQYQRLEAPGLWRETPEAQRREVVLSFGKATLVISDGRSGRALSHWSLPAIERRNPGEMPAIFAPGPDATETVEIDDTTMVTALARVHSIIEARRPHPGRLRVALFAAGAAAVLCAAILWVPGAVVRHVTTVIPQEKRVEIGQSLLSDIFRLSGSACASPEGREALAALNTRLGGNPDEGIIVLATGLQGAAHLPGGTVLVGRDLVEDQPVPEVLAGYVIAERVRATAVDPLAALLRWTGLRASFSLLTTGDLPPDSLVGFAEEFLTRAPAPLSASDLTAAFHRADLPLAPYAAASGLAAAAPASAETADPASHAPVLNDDQWVALQGICAG
jgi:hypothetical protein